MSKTEAEKKIVLITTTSFGKHDLSPMRQLTEAGFSTIMNPYRRKLTEEEIASLIRTHDPVGIIAGVEPLTASVLQTARNLKVISRCGIGMDSVDQDSAKKLGITVTNTPDAPTVPAAELTVGLIISLLRGIRVSDASIRKGQWQRPMGNLVFGKTVGIVGCGRIGSCVGKLLSSFECTILGYDTACSEKTFPRMVDSDELLCQSDIITLHLPYNRETHHFINREKIRMMKKGAYLVNAARGGLMDEDAVYDALVSGHLKGAAIDTFEQEPYSGRLASSDNVLLTAHIGSYAVEGRIRMEIEAARHLIVELGKAGISAHE